MREKTAQLFSLPETSPEALREEGFFIAARMTHGAVRRHMKVDFAFVCDTPMERVPSCML